MLNAEVLESSLNCEKWSVAVFLARETPSTAISVLQSIQNASIQPVAINLLVNGNRLLADNLCTMLESTELKTNAIVHTYYFEMGDKANTFNQYLRYIWDGQSLPFFVDGYVKPKPDAFGHIEQALYSSSDAWAATGVPSIGYSAKKISSMLVQTHGLHGNMFCLKPEIAKEIVSIGIRLPLGLYRTDSLLGAILKFSFDPSCNAWNNDRIAVNPSATWLTPRRHWWNPIDVVGHIKRLHRQVQGDLEIQAIKYFFLNRKIHSVNLPSTVHDLVTIWVRECPTESARALNSHIARIAYKKISKQRDWSAVCAVPIIVSSI